MEACLKAGVNYLDTANYGPKDGAHFESTHGSGPTAIASKKAGLTAILGCGFDPGVSAMIFVALRRQAPFSPRCVTLDIVDCNAGNHGKAFCHQFQS